MIRHAQQELPAMAARITEVGIPALHSELVESLDRKILEALREAR